uniref:(northern house mosquito) hypothetical protein n=1 Tax=Culex pipiens TaxID=7175 RepID=A0A8D8AWL3_CULPI
MISFSAESTLFTTVHFILDKQSLVKFSIRIGVILRSLFLSVTISSTEVKPNLASKLHSKLFLHQTRLGCVDRWSFRDYFFACFSKGTSKYHKISHKTKLTN